MHFLTIPRFTFVIKPWHYSQETVDSRVQLIRLLVERRPPPTSIPGWLHSSLTTNGSVADLSSLTSGSWRLDIVPMEPALSMSCWELTMSGQIWPSNHLEIFYRTSFSNRETVEDGRLEIASNEIFTHENYNGLSIRNDIGLVHLPEPVEFTGEIQSRRHCWWCRLSLDWIRPICLPSYSEWNSTWYHLDMQISGWGESNL